MNFVTNSNTHREKSGPKQSLTGFGKSVFEFNLNLTPPKIETLGFDFINPFEDDRIVKIQKDFCSKYYKGTGKRLGIFGINPGRLGAGITGIPFTDPKNLKQVCGIDTLEIETAELSSEFVYSVIQNNGGVQTFYQKFYVGSVCPLGLLSNGRNANYYDNPLLAKHLRPWIAGCLESQVSIGLRRDAVIILGTGKNAKFFINLNDEFSFFRKVYVLEHPRYIMQYRRKQKLDFQKNYNALLEIF